MDTVVVEVHSNKHRAELRLGELKSPRAIFIGDKVNCFDGDEPHIGFTSNNGPYWVVVGIA
jgi:hypothetical protein